MRTNFMTLLIIIAAFQAIPNPSFSQSKELISVRSTSLVMRSIDGDRQVCVAEINSPVTGSCTLEVAIPGRPLIKMAEPPLNQKITFTVPVIEVETMVTARIRQSGKIISESKSALKPPKKWTVYDVQVSHHDLGYADYYHMMRRDVREWGIELALENCRLTDSWPKESRFHWTVETSEPMTGFLQYQPDSVIAELTRRIKEGRIELGGLHNSVSTEHMSYEVLARAFYTPNRYIVDWMGIPPSKTALDTDVVGFVRSLPLFTKEADIPYFMMGINSSVVAFDQAYRDAAYYWKAQDNDPKMTLFKTWPYYSPDRLVAYNSEEISSLLGRYESRQDYPYGCILSEDSYDFGLPEMTNVEKIKSWNSKFSNPVIVSATMSMFFDDIASQKNLKEFTVYDKDAPNAWADEDLADARLESDARFLGYRIPGVEKLATMVTATGGGRYPWSDLCQAYNRLLMYHEHTDGAYAEGPIYVPPSLKDSTAANANYYEVEQGMHRSLVSESREYLEKAETVAIGSLKKLITTGKETTLAVYNPLNYVRTDVVTFNAPGGEGGWQLYDNTTARTVACQKWPDGTLFFVATDVPQSGYKTYSIRPDPKVVPAAAKTMAGEEILENKYYRLVFDPKTGGIKSITDKELGRELVDQSAPTKFNEYLYQRYETARHSVAPVSYTPEKATLSCFRGTLADMMVSNVTAFGCNFITQYVILYNNIKRIDFLLNIDKSPSGRSLNDFRQGNAKNKEALFYSLPFSVPGFTIRHELPGAVVEPIADQFEGSSTDYYGIQHFTDLSNKNFGITLATVDAPLVEYGKPRAASWGKPDGYEHSMKKSENSRVYLYLLNNMFFTNIRMSQPGPMTFRWSVRSHRGNWKSGGASRFGWETSHPLEAIILPAENQGQLPANSYSFLGIDRGNITCTTIKPAEANGSGIICRFFELNGEKTTVNIDLHFIGKIRQANETNLVEADRNIPVTVTGNNRITLTIPPHGIRTIRIIPEENTVGAVGTLTAEALSDRQIQLNWNKPETGSGEVAYYRIYRGKDKNFSADLRHLAGSSGATSFVDEPVLNFGGWINNYVEPETHYYYRICPVSRGNIQGPVSEAIESVTLSSKHKDLPPAKIEGVHVVHVSPITNDNYLCLFFYSNIESDVVRYQIYRSKKEGFQPTASDLIGEINASQIINHTTPHGFNTVQRHLSEFIQQMYADESVEPDTDYYYQACAVDRGGNRSEFSDEVSGKAVLSHLTIEGNRFFFTGGTRVSIRPVFANGAEVHYTTDGKIPSRLSPKYNGPIMVSKPLKLQAAVFYPGSDKPEALAEATFSEVIYPAPKYNTNYGSRWAGTGIFNLVDGQRGQSWNDGYWQGFESDDLDVVIDLGKSAEISEVSLGTIQFPASWIFLPVEVGFSISPDGINFKSAGKADADPALERVEDVIREYTVRFDKQKVRYIHVVAKNKKICPEWHLGAGGKAWIFADEVTVK